MSTSLRAPLPDLESALSTIMTAEGSAVVPETPKLPRGILKQNEANHKKRRVVFAGSTEARSPTSKENEESVYNVTKVLKTPTCFLC